MLPMTHTQIYDGRGGGSREQLSLMTKICSQNLQNCEKSIIPILTKCPVYDENKPDENTHDLDIIRKDLREQLEEQHKADKNRMRDFQDLDNSSSNIRSSTMTNNTNQSRGSDANMSGSSSGVQERPSPFEFELQERLKFYNKLSDRLVIFDPLDRDVCNSYQDVQSIKTNELKKMLKEL